ncbi:carbohydrate kinase family protein [Patescibacteria group bacterium]
MYDVITIGSATKDIYLISRDFKLIRTKKFRSGMGECFSYGSKIELGDVYFDTGGGATNAAYTFANLGLKTSVVSKVGKDIYGMEILQILAENNIDTSNISVDNEHSTAYSSILSTPGADRTILVFRGASANFTASDFHWPKLKTKWFYISSLAGDLTLLKKVFAFAKKQKIKIAWNPGSSEFKHPKAKLAELIKQVSIFNVNKEEAAKLTGQKDIKKMFVYLNKLNKSFNIITDGANGAYLSDGVMIYYAKAIGSKPINTTGAGDAFGSGFCTGMILKNDWDYAMRLAILNSDGVITKLGAKNGLLNKLPKQKDLDKVKLSILS